MFRFANSFRKKGLPVESKTWQVAYEDLEFHKTLGEGNFGTVFHGTYFGTDVAVKKINDDEQKYLDREVILLKSIRHPNIVQLMGVCEHSTGLYLVTELLPGGTLRKKLKNLAVPLPWGVRLGICIDMARALTFLHSKEITHRDLKSKNVLLDEHFKVKICDFGLARTMDMDGVPRRMTVCGTDEWMAPEVASSSPYTEMADVFSFGVILLEVIFRQKPNQDCIRKSLLYGVDLRMVMERRPKDVPDKLFDLAIRTCAMDWATRPQMAHCLQELKAAITELQASEAAAATEPDPTQPTQPTQPRPTPAANQPASPAPSVSSPAVNTPAKPHPPPISTSASASASASASLPATTTKPPPPPPPLPEPRRSSAAFVPAAKAAQETPDINDETLIELALKASSRRRSTVGQRPPDLASLASPAQTQTSPQTQPQSQPPPRPLQTVHSRASVIPAKPTGPPPPKPPPPRPSNPPPQIPNAAAANTAQGSANSQPAVGTPRERIHQADRPGQSYRVGGQGPNSFEIFVNPMVGSHGQIDASDLSTYDDEGSSGSSPSHGAKSKNDPRQSFVQKLFGKSGDH